MTRRSLQARVVELVVQSPGLLGPKDITARLFPHEPRPARPYRTAAERRLELQARRQARELQAARFADELARVREAIRGGRKAGLLQPATHCHLSPIVEPRVKRDGVGILQDWRWGDGDDDDHTKVLQDAPQLCGHALAIVQVLIEGPCPPAELRRRTGGLTPAGNERGAWRRAWDRLELDQVVVARTHLWPTERAAGRS